MRYLQAHNFIGAVFIKLLKEDKTEITLKELNNIEKSLDKDLRRNNNALIYVTADDIYTLINTYNFFKIDSRGATIKLSDCSVEKYNSSKAELLDTLDSYFQAGIPLDILDTIDNILKGF